MRSRILIAGVLAYVSCALSQDSPLVPPPPFIKVQIREVQLQGVCLVNQDSVLLYSRPREPGYAALATRAANGAQVYAGVPVHAENCTDSSTAWPDVAVGEVQAAVSPAGNQYAKLVIGTRALGQCQLHVDLPLIPPQGGGTCAPLNPGAWGYCGCPQIFTDLKAAP
jgi:hypothetical protein